MGSGISTLIQWPAWALGGAAVAAVVFIALLWKFSVVFFSRRPSYIKSIKKRPAPPPELAGDRGSSLFGILNAGGSTPRGFILCTPAFRSVMRSPAEGPPESVSWPVRVFKLKRALGSHFRAGEKVIVRSSFHRGDSAEAGFAGVYGSVRDVPARDVNAVIDAVIKVYASYWSERARRYRTACGEPPDGRPIPEPDAAVIIQLQVDHEWNGVAFSLNPHSGCRDEFVVEAKKEDAEKNLVYIFDLDTGVWRSPTQEECPALPRLEAMLPRLEKLEGGPVQVEWGMTGDIFHVFQAQPAAGLLNSESINEDTPERAAKGETLEGTGNNCGAASGAALVQEKPEFARPELMKGVILVTESPSPDWIAWLPYIDGLVLETGDALSPLVMAATEKGVPVVTGAAGAMRRLETGMEIEMDSDAGTIKIKAAEEKE